MIPPGTRPLQIKPHQHSRATTPRPPRPPPSVSPHPWQDEGMRSSRALCGPLGFRSHFIRCQMCGNSSYYGKPPPQQQIQITPKKEVTHHRADTVTRKAKLLGYEQHSIPLQFSSTVSSSACWHCKFVKFMHCLSLSLKPWSLMEKTVDRNTVKTPETSQLGANRPTEEPQVALLPEGLQRNSAISHRDDGACVWLAPEGACARGSLTHTLGFAALVQYYTSNSFL